MNEDQSEPCIAPSFFLISVQSILQHLQNIQSDWFQPIGTSFHQLYLNMRCGLGCFLTAVNIGKKNHITSGN